VLLGIALLIVNCAVLKCLPYREAEPLGLTNEAVEAEESTVGITCLLIKHVAPLSSGVSAKKIANSQRATPMR